MEFEKDYFKVGERYGRVLYLKDYASYISDEMVSEFADINQNMMISIDIIPIPTDEAVNEAQNRLWAWKQISRTGSGGRMQPELFRYRTL